MVVLFLVVTLLSLLPPDLIDVVRDQIYDASYLEAEDPKLFYSEKTGRGPLQDSWIQDYWHECKVSVQDYWQECKVSVQELVENII